MLAKKVQSKKATAGKAGGKTPKSRTMLKGMKMKGMSGGVSSMGKISSFMGNPRKGGK